MADPAFLADATAGFNETPARGPYTLAGSNSAIFVPLANMTTDYEAIVAKIRAGITDGSAASYLPADYRSDPTMVAGYERQLTIIAKLLADRRVPSLETTFATGTSLRGIHLHPLSRGTVRLNATDPLQGPVVSYGTGAHPVDFDIYLAHTRYMRRMISDTATMQQYGAVDAAPGAAVQSDEALLDYVKSQLTLSFMHPCCTAAMMPRDRGGVVGTDLKVHGAAGLRVVDMSILPFLPSAHLSATAYAVGEKVSALLHFT